MTMGANCGTCEHSKHSSGKMVFCLLLGIFIHNGHTGCKYLKPGRDGSAEIIRNRSGEDVRKRN